DKTARSPPWLERTSHRRSDCDPGKRRASAPSQFTNETEALVGAEHRVRTGDLRLGKANRPSHQRFPLLTNPPQPAETIRGTNQLRKHRFTNHPRPCTAVLFHRCSKMVPVHSTSPRPRCSWDGQETPSVPLASEETSLTSRIISTPTASPVRPSQTRPDGTPIRGNSSSPPALRNGWNVGTVRGATATGKGSRKDFGLVWNKTLETGRVAVGEEVQLTIDAELVGRSEGRSELESARSTCRERRVRRRSDSTDRRERAG